MVTSRFPLPPWRGNQVRAMEWLEALEGHERVVLTPAPEDPRRVAELEARGVEAVTYDLPPVARAWALLTCVVRGGTLQEGLYRVASARAALSRLLHERRWHAVVVQMLRCGWAAETVRAEAPQAPILFDAIDAMGLHFARSGVSFPPLLRPVVSVEAARSARRESWLAGVAAITTAVSQRDLDALAVPDGRGRVVPVAGRRLGASHRPPPVHTVLLSGNLGYRPTVAAARWFATEVWPALVERVPGVRWVLAGARPAPAVRALDRLDGVEVHGDVPDLDRYLTAATVAIAPMATGSGVPMKVLEAWAAGVPVVVHPWAARGLAQDPAPGVEVAAAPEDWVAALARLLGDPSAAGELAARGRRVWERHYHPDRVATAIRDAVDAAAQ
jgi:hypothetical protein